MVRFFRMEFLFKWCIITKEILVSNQNIQMTDSCKHPFCETHRQIFTQKIMFEILVDYIMKLWSNTAFQGRIRQCQPLFVLFVHRRLDTVGPKMTKKTYCGFERPAACWTDQRGIYKVWCWWACISSVLAQRSSRFFLTHAVLLSWIW